MSGEKKAPAEGKWSVPVTADLRPAYYDDFRCLAAGCRISCCKDWSITFNKKDYLSLKRQDGSPDLNARLGSGLRRIRKGTGAEMFYGEFDMDSGVCPLLREDCLCQLQCEKGHGALPRVCRTYPRSSQYAASGYLERSLSPSCEGVLELLWELPEGIEFRSDPLPQEQQKYVVFSESVLLPKWFPVIREWCIDLLQDRRFPLPQRIWLMGLGLKELADGETDIRRWVERAAALPENVGGSVVLPTGDRELAMFLGSCIYTLLGFQPQEPSLKAARSGVLESMNLSPTTGGTGGMTIPYAPYREARERFETVFQGREYFMENLMTTIFFYLNMPYTGSGETLWKGYVNFCNLYSIYRFLSVMSCREGVEDPKEELFRLTVLASRALLHNQTRQTQLRDGLFQNESATLAHMAILLGG